MLRPVHERISDNDRGPAARYKNGVERTHYKVVNYSRSHCLHVIVHRGRVFASSNIDAPKFEEKWLAVIQNRIAMTFLENG